MMPHALPPIPRVVSPHGAPQPLAQTTLRLFASLLAAAAVALPAFAAEPRSSAAVRDFRRFNPCPATGYATGPCPGHVVDHIKPLCAGGPDHRSNMQWQTIEEAKKKDIEESRLCAELRRQRK